MVAKDRGLEGLDTVGIVDNTGRLWCQRKSRVIGQQGKGDE